MNVPEFPTFFSSLDLSQFRINASLIYSRYTSTCQNEINKWENIMNVASGKDDIGTKMGKSLIDQTGGLYYVIQASLGKTCMIFSTIEHQ